MRIYPIKIYLLSIPNIILLSLAILTNIGIWVWLLWQIRPQEEFIFLHYNVLFGVDKIGPWYHVLALPLLGVAVILINTIIGWIHFEKDKFVGFILNMVSVFCQMFLAIAAYLLVFLNV